jgi:uncharacterized damage-inducible protein DinB
MPGGSSRGYSDEARLRGLTKISLPTTNVRSLSIFKGEAPMAVENRTLVVFYSNWKRYQDHLKEAIAPLTEAQLALQAGPGLRTVGELAAHIIGARMGWFTEFLGEAGGDAASLAAWDVDDAPARTVAELVAGLDQSWQFMADALDRWSPAEMEAASFPIEWGGEHHDLSRSWVIWHLLEHDLHHGGEISLTLGMHGLQAPDV